MYYNSIMSSFKPMKTDKLLEKKIKWKGGLSRQLALKPPKFMNRGYLTEEQLNSFIDDATDYPELFRPYLDDTLLDWTDKTKAKWTQSQLLKTITNIANEFMEDEDTIEERDAYEGKGGRSRETSSKRFPVSADSFRKIGGKKSVKIIGAKQLATRATKKEVIAEEGATYDRYEGEHFSTTQSYRNIGGRMVLQHYQGERPATHMNIGYDTNLVVKLGDQREMTQQIHLEGATDAPYPIFDNRWAEEAEELEEGYVVNAPKKQGDPLWFQTHSGKEWNTPEGIGYGYWSRNLGIREPEEVAPIRDKYTGGEFRDYPREGKAKYTAHNFNKVINKTTGALQGGDAEYWEHYLERGAPINYALGKDSIPIKYAKGTYVENVMKGDLYDTNDDSYYTPTTGNHMWGGQNPKRQGKVHMKQEVFEGLNYKTYRVPVKGETREIYEGGEGIFKYRGFSGKEVVIRGIEDLKKLNLTQLKHIAKIQGIPVEDLEMDVGGVGGGGNKRLFTTSASGRSGGQPHLFARSMKVWEENTKTGEWEMKKKIIKSGQLDKFTKEGGQRRQYRKTALDKEEIIDMIMKGGTKPLKKYVVPKGWVEGAVEQNLEDEGAEYGGALGEAVIENEMEGEVGKEERDLILAEHATETDAPIDPNAPPPEKEEEGLVDIQGEDSDDEFDPIDDSEVINDVILDNHDPNKIIAHETDIDHLIGATGIIRDAIENRVAEDIEQQTYKKRKPRVAVEQKTPRATDRTLMGFEDRPNYPKPDKVEDTRTNYRIKKPLMVGKKSSVNPSIWSQEMNDGQIILQDSYSGFHIPESISGQQIKQYQDKSYIGGANIKRDTKIKKPIDTGSISTAPLPRFDWKLEQPKQAPFKGTKYNMSVEGIQKTKEYSDYMSSNRETPFKGTRWNAKPTHHYSQGRTRTTEYSDYMSAKTLLKRPEHIFYDEHTIGSMIEKEGRYKWAKRGADSFSKIDTGANPASTSLMELVEDLSQIGDPFSMTEPDMEDID